MHGTMSLKFSASLCILYCVFGWFNNCINRSDVYGMNKLKTRFLIVMERVWVSLWSIGGWADGWTNEWVNKMVQGFWGIMLWRLGYCCSHWKRRQTLLYSTTVRTSNFFILQAPSAPPTLHPTVHSLILRTTDNSREMYVCRWPWHLV